MHGPLENPSSYEQQRMQHSARLLELAGPLLEQMDWSKERLETHRNEKLRFLIRHARARSPWHAKRLASLDADSLTVADLSRIPPMTKTDLMVHWDEIVTHPCLSLARCEDHLDRMREPAYLDNEFHVIASGGSSGRRGVFAYGWDEWAVFYFANARWLPRAMALRGIEMNADTGVAVVAAASPTHATSILTQTFAQSRMRAARFPVGQPLAEMVAGLNEFQPGILVAYASALDLLTVEAAAGRLDIQPAIVSTTAEPLLPEVAERIERTWGSAPLNSYGTSDVGIMGGGCGLAAGIHLSEDMLIVEPVDSKGHPAQPGQTSAKAYVTSLEQLTLPVIRYELTDELTLVDDPCPCGSSLRRIRDVQGRLDDAFRYASGVDIHAHVFRSPLSRQRNVVEYQVRQSEDGAEIDVVDKGPVDVAALESEIAKHLEEAGLTQASVTIHCVHSIPRVGVGKLKRFVSLPPADS